jgi:ABC-type glycerol-3-phosphate transport system substrate-binding protein
MAHLRASMHNHFGRIGGLLMVLVLLASCGGAPATTPTAAPAATQAPAAVAPTAAAPEAATTAAAPAAAAPSAATAQATAAAGEPVTLRIMHWTGQMVEDTPWWKDVLDGFKAQHPNVTIENNFVPFPQYLPTLEANAASNSLPDVFFAHVKAAELGRAGLTINYHDYFDDAFFKQFYGSPLKQFTFDGDKLYALPWTAQIFGVFVNTPIIQQLGLQPPETWDDLIAMAPKIRAAGYTPLMWGNQGKNVCPDFVLPLVTQYGGDVYALDDLTQPGVTWNSEPVVNALKLLKRLADAKVFVDGINGVTEDQARELAFQGKAAMLYTGSWIPTVIDEQAPPDYAKNYTVAKFPALKAGDKHWTGDGSGEGWAINAKSPNRDLAIEFVKYLFSDEVYNKTFKSYQSMPSKPAAMSQITNEKVQTMASWIDDGTDHILFGKGNWDALSSVCQGVLDGTVDPVAGAAQIQKDIEATRSR